MLIESLLAVAPLLALPSNPAQETVPSLAWGIPEGAPIAMRWNDPKGMFANSQKNAWIGFLQDPRWLESDIIEQMGVEMDEWFATWELLGPLLTESSEMVFWMDSIAAVTPNVYLAVQTSESAIQAVTVQFTDPSKRGTQGDLPYLMLDDSLVMWEGDLILVHTGPEPETVLPELATRFRAMQSLESPAGPFETTPLGADRNPEHLEFLADITALLDSFPMSDADLEEMPPFFMGEVRAMEWFYMAASFGEGQSLDTTYVLPYKEDGYLAHFFEFAGAANHDAFRRVPVQAIGAAVGNFDIASAIYWIVDELVAAEELDPDEFEMGLQEMQDTLGIHIMEDFVNYMTGDVLQITFPVDDIEDEMQGLLAYSYGLMVMDVQAMEDVQRALSGLMLAAAEAVEVEESEVLWGKLWQLDLMGMFGIEVGTFPGSMFVSFHPAAVQQFQAHANSGSDTPNFYTLPGVQKVLGELEGSYTYLFQTSELFDSVANLMGDMALMEEDEELDFLTDLLQDASEIAADHLDGWVGSTVSFDGRIRVQSIAR